MESIVSSKFFDTFEQFSDQLVTWKSLVGNDVDSENLNDLYEYLKNEYETQTIYPPKSLIFNIFQQLNLQQIRVIIISQDPYIKEGQAMGLSFSVPDSVKIPPSLVNIYKAIKQNYPEFEIPKSGNLQRWVEQGIFLLNSILTCRENKSNSHSNMGWEVFTDSIITHINNNSQNVVFMLWGQFAQKKIPLIDTKKHLILKYSHPSPLCQIPFINCNHFKQANEYLQEHNQKQINWQI